MKVSAPHRGWTSGRATPSLRPTPMRQRQQTRQDATYRSRKSVQTTGAGSCVRDKIQLARLVEWAQPTTGGQRPTDLDPEPSFARGSPPLLRELALGSVVTSCYSHEWGGVRMAETRKIAAILAADVVGFSRMASADEDRTLARLRSLRADLIDPTVASHNGRVFKRTGDGALIEFRSVVEAVRCAVAIQNAMIERNVGISPDQRIEFRIGIHLGDVVEESDGDLMGDGVNIAARLEGVAGPGAICLSEDAYRQVRARTRYRGHRSRADPAEEHRRTDPGLFAPGRRRRTAQGGGPGTGGPGVA